MVNLLPVLLFSVSSSLTPGPNNFMLLSSGLNHGVKKTMPHFLGICIGFPIMVMIVALGFGAIFVKHLWIKEALKYIGSAYMLFLAWQIYQSSGSQKSEQGTRKPFRFYQAVLFQWVNPKAWLMAVGAISIFTLSQNYLMNAVAISTIFFLVFIPCGIVWLLFGKFLQNILTKPGDQKIFNIVMALSLVASIVLIFIE